MSHLVCPMCGKLTSLARFDPSGFERDISVKKVKGMGYRKGFAVVGEYSILGNNSTVLKVRDRSLSILSMLFQNGLVSKDLIIHRLGIEPEPEPEPAYADAPETKSELEEVAEEVEVMIYDAMDMNTANIDESTDIAARLRSAVRRLIGDYLDYRDSNE